MPDPARAARARSGACVAPPPYCASAEQFWPAMLRFELFDGRACESTAKQKRILSCANLPVPTWPGVDPMPHARKLRPRRPGKQAASLPLSLRLAVVAGAAAVDQWSCTWRGRCMGSLRWIRFEVAIAT